jgi:eukaryotic-like serine/threonine-protein kinase
MGVVYRAHDTLLEREVALKIIGATIEGNTELRERFFREARAAGQLSHRNVITIHDLGEHEGQPYLAMEFLKGEDLQHRLVRPEPMTLTRKLEIASEICEGLAYAHRRGLIHRDIKPANIFITDEGVVKILDFGLARMVTSELTGSNMMLGTLNYMAPEQVRGERIDHRADIFSFGVVLYEILSGRKAFQGDSFATTLYKILQDVPEPLLNIDATLPYEVVMLVEKAIAKGRDDRYQDLSELSRDLALQRQHLAIADMPTAVTSAHRIPSDPPRSSTLRRPDSGRSRPPSGGAADQIPPDAPTGMTPLPQPRPRSKAPVIIAGVLVAALAGLAIWLSRRDDTVTRPPAVETSAPSATTPAAPPATAPTPSPAAQPPTAAPSPAPADSSTAVRAADEARTRMARAKAAARQAGNRAVRSPSFGEGLAAEREGGRLYQAKQMAEATARFYEAAGHFRSAELAAAAADTQPPPQARSEPPATTTVTPAPPPGSAAPAPVVPAPPATTSAPPPEPAPASPPPPIPPVVRTPPASSNPAADSPRVLEEGVRELIRRYEQALEARSVEALKRLWPSLPDSQEQAMRENFSHARRIDVEISSIDIAVSGSTAVATFLRRYQVLTDDNQRPVIISRTTLNARRNGGDWVIERVRFEGVK